MSLGSERCTLSTTELPRVFIYVVRGAMHSDSSYSPPKKKDILRVLFATNAEGWSITANDQLVIDLAKNPRVKVYGLVPKSTQEQRDLAKKSNIELVDAKRRLGYSEEELIAHPPDNLDIDIVIIHSYGRNLGKQAQEIKEKKNCKWVHVVHTISEELENYMQKVSSTDTANPGWLSDHELQLALCGEADIIIAIGPKVADAYKRALRHCGKHKDVITMTPGIIHDLAGVQTVCEGGEKFHVMISATYPSKYFKVKGCDIAAKAITLLEDLSYNLTFVVLPNDDAEVLKSQLEGLISLSQFKVKHVPRSTENWRKQLCEVDLVILPSAEGFGTSCVRAISAGVPVLSSGNSGFGMALKELPSGKMHVLDSEKPQDWADKIKELRDMGPTQLAREAKQLREEYMAQYCWKDQCDKLVNILMEIVPSKEESQKVGVEHTEKITQVVTYTESRMQQLEIKNSREQEHDTVDEGDKNPDSRIGQENEECVESEVDKLRMSHQEEGVGVTKTSVEETGVTDQKSDSLAQKNIVHDAVDGGVSPQTKSSRLSTNVKNIPYALLSKICLKLNTPSDVFFNDFRMLGQLMKIERDFIESLAHLRNSNPTHEILTRWWQTTREPTVEKLIKMLEDKDMQRMDVVEILEDWVEKGDSK